MQPFFNGCECGINLYAAPNSLSPSVPLLSPLLNPDFFSVVEVKKVRFCNKEMSYVHQIALKGVQVENSSRF